MEEAAVFTSEADFRKWFEQNLDEFGVKEIVLSQEVCPDYVVMMKDGRPAKIEAELFAINFKYHGHDPEKADYIVACYSKTEEVMGVPVLAKHRLWCFDMEPLDSLPPEAPLAEEEARLLSAIHQSGGISVSALSEGCLAGEQLLYVRVRPELIASIPHRTIGNSVFNVLTQQAKQWLRKYHHILVGAKLSKEGCELIESLVRRGLIEYRPIVFLASVFDGVIVEHPAWVPMELHATSAAWEHHQEDIMKYLLGGQSREKQEGTA